jgi:hypothetical protein
MVNGSRDCECGLPIEWTKSLDGLAYFFAHGSHPDVRHATFGPEDFSDRTRLVIPASIDDPFDFDLIRAWVDKVHRRRSQRR